MSTINIQSARAAILVPPHILAFHAYEPGLSCEEVRHRFGLDRVIKLAANENPLGVSPIALERAQESLAGLSRYPDGGLALRHKLAELFNVKTANVIADAGSEGIMANIVRTFLCDDDEVLTTEAAFQGFQVLARGRGVPYRTVPYRDWQYDLPALADAITPRTKLIYLANPNNPTGTFFTRRAFEEFYQRIPERVLIILDEAYYEFAMVEPSYPDSMHYRFDNVITLRTFSKVHGLAAARVGYGFAHEDLISVLLKVKLPFEPSGPAQAAALGALEDREFMLRTVANNSKGLVFLSTSLRDLGFQVVPSAANFVMLVFAGPEQAKHVFENLLRRGVIVRPLASCGLPECLRVSVGTPEENQLFVTEMESMYASAK
ncbi:MAG TPA: histidinol-phosphate transaminase [Bryobacteraceae bacterium]|nr:histidinol-phosphate transaminase [Bryobacteraceae bacterium]